MKLAKSLLLASAATLAASASYAADLPSKNAAPANHVKVCDIYGAGFFYIPGTDTCLKVGGRVRADYAMSGKDDVYSASYTATTCRPLSIPPRASARPPRPRRRPSRLRMLSSASGSQNLYGWETRGRVDLDARSSTAYGTVQAIASIRLARTTGILDQNGPAASSTSAAATLEAAYIRFAGFTFGAAKDNFSFMPSTYLRRRPFVVVRQRRQADRLHGGLRRRHLGDGRDPGSDGHDGWWRHQC